MIQEIPERRTLNGLFDAHCRLCGEPVYCLWIDDEDPQGACVEGASVVTDCRQAMSTARERAALVRFKQETGK